MSDGVTGVVREIGTATNQNLTILYRLQNEVTISVNPTCAGMVIPSQSWYNPGTLATAHANAAASYKCLNYSGDLSYTDAALKFPVSGPVNLVANFNCTNCEALRSTPAAINLGAHPSMVAHIASSDPAARIPFIIDPDFPPWLLVSLSSSTIPADLMVRADVSALESGSHNTTITVHPMNLPSGVAVPDLQIPVTLGLVDVVINSVPAGLNVLVDNASQVTPAQFKWVSGTQHRLNAATQIVGSAKYVPGVWSDGASESHAVIAPAPGALVAYTENFVPYYQLTLKADPAAGGSLSCQSCF